MVKRMLRSVLFVTLMTYGGLCIYALLFADKTIFQPGRASYAAGDQWLTISASDGVRLAAVHLPNPEARYTLLFSHGNAEDLGVLLPYLELYRRQGFAVFAYDYRGYGLSEGAPSEAGAYRDIDAAYRYLIDQLGVPPERIIGYGRSLGGAVTIDLAARQPLAGLIVESSFTSAFGVLPVTRIMPFDKFASKSKLGRVGCPVLVIHGRRDEVIPFAHGEALYAAAPEPKRFLWIDAAYHNNVAEAGGEPYLAALRAFAELVRERQDAGGR